jgi:hypothetical protein
LISLDFVKTLLLYLIFMGVAISCAHYKAGPPAAGKSTWVHHHAKPGDITIDYDAIASVLTPDGDSHDHAPHIKTVTKAARQAAIDAALTLHDNHDVYVIHSSPSAGLIEHYLAHGAQIRTPLADATSRQAVVRRPRQQTNKRPQQT